MGLEKKQRRRGGLVNSFLFGLKKTQFFACSTYLTWQAVHINKCWAFMFHCSLMTRLNKAELIMRKFGVFIPIHLQALHTRGEKASYQVNIT